MPKFYLGNHSQYICVFKLRWGILYTESSDKFHQVPFETFKIIAKPDALQEGHSTDALTAAMGLCLCPPGSFLVFREEGLPFIPSKGKSILTLSNGGSRISRETGAVCFSLLRTETHAVHPKALCGTHCFCRQEGFIFFFRFNCDQFK